MCILVEEDVRKFVGEDVRIFFENGSDSGIF